MLKHLQHHSLALFLIHLCEVQIVQPEAKKEHWEMSDGSDAEANEQTADNEPSPEQLLIQKVLKEKTKMVTQKLISQLSNKN